MIGFGWLYKAKSKVEESECRESEEGEEGDAKMNQKEEAGTAPCTTKDADAIAKA